MINADTILDTMKKWVEEKHPISPAQWLDAGAKLNILRGDYDDLYFDLESLLAKEKAQLLSSQEMTSSKAESIIKAKDEYKDMRKLGAKIKMIEEFIRISKKQATLKETEWINNK